MQGKQLAIIDKNFKAVSGQVSSLAGGDGFFDNVKARALAGLDTWVPALFPTAVKSANGAWRVTSADLAQYDPSRGGYEEDLSAAPSGNQDYGPEDGLTPIDVMMRLRRRARCCRCSVAALQVDGNSSSDAWVEAAEAAPGSLAGPSTEVTLRLRMRRQTRMRR